MILVEGLLLAVFVAFMATQVLVPLVEGSSLFPVFRRESPRHKVEDALRDLNEEAVVSAMELEFLARRKALDTARQQAKQTEEGETKTNGNAHVG